LFFERNVRSSYEDEIGLKPARRASPLFASEELL
jgi:hypothetical protein